MPATVTLAYLTCGLRIDGGGNIFCSCEWSWSESDISAFWVFDFYDLINIVNVFFLWVKDIVQNIALHKILFLEKYK